MYSSSDKLETQTGKRRISVAPLAVAVLVRR